jgi:hypothetical protein
MLWNAMKKLYNYNLLYGVLLRDFASYKEDLKQVKIE